MSVRGGGLDGVGGGGKVRDSATKTIGQRIARARDSYGLSQVQLAANLDVTRAAVSQYEKDIIRPRDKVIETLAAFFKCDREWFEHGRGKQPSPADAPMVLQEINAMYLSKVGTTIGDAASGGEWRLPFAIFAGAGLSVRDHIAVTTAPNAVGPIHKGDRVVIDTGRRRGEGVVLVVSDGGPRLLKIGQSTNDQHATAPIVGYVIAFLRTL